MSLIDFILGINSQLDSCFSWYIAICGCIFHILVVGHHMASGVVFVLIQDRYGVSKELASYPMNTLASVQCIFAITSGPILHVIKFRKTLLLGTFLGVLGSCLSVHSPIEDTITWLTFCMAIRGIAASVSGPATMQAALTHFKKHRAKAFTILYLFFPIGGLILPSIVRLADEEYGLEWSWLIHAAIYAQATLLAVLIKPRREVDQTRQSRNKIDSNELETFLKNVENDDKIERAEKLEKSKPKRETLSSILNSVLREKTFYVLMIAQTILNCTIMAFRMTIVDYGRDTNLDENLNKFILEILSLADIARIVAALVVDSRLCHEETILTFSCFLSAISLFLMTTTVDWWFVVVAFSYSILFAASSSCHAALYATLGVTRLAISLGISFSVNGVFQLGLPFLIGLFRDKYGSYDYLFYTFALLNVLLAFLFGWSWKKRCFDHRQ